VHVVKPVFGGELGQDRVLQQSLRHVRVVDAADRAAHVQLEQPETALVDVQVRPGERGGLGITAAQDGRYLDVGHPGGAGERGQVAPVEPGGQADQRGAQVRQVGLELIALFGAEEERPGEVPALVQRPEELRFQLFAPDQLAGGNAASLDLVKVRSAEARSVHGIASFRR
jgi:hypothetical protein